MINQLTLFESLPERKVLDELISEARLYHSGRDYKELLDFVVRLRRIAPFNAMLLQIQKPGLTYAATAKDWRERFNRSPKENARPLIIMRNFGPVNFVFDILDTEGPDLPKDVLKFTAKGEISKVQMLSMQETLRRSQIDCIEVDEGDARAGLIKLTTLSEENGNRYQVHLNQNHDVPTRFATLAHELGHLFLGHLGNDTKRKIAGRAALPHDLRELEAESVAYMVCHRRNIEPRIAPYLADFVKDESVVNRLDIYTIMVATNNVERVLH